MLVVKLVLNFLAPRKLSTYSRQIEYGAQLLTKEVSERSDGALRKTRNIYEPRRN